MMNAQINSQQPSSTWLKQTSRLARPWQLGIFVVRLFQLAAQITTFGAFSRLMHLIVVEQQAVFFNEMLPLIMAMCTWVVCSHMADAMTHQAKAVLEANIEHNVHRQLQEKQLVLTRKFSTTYWQQLLMNNLGDVGDFLTQYTVQKWLAAMGPFIVISIIWPVNYIVALMLLITMPIVPLFMILVGKGAASLHRKHFVALERLGDMFSDRLRGLKLVTSTGQHNAQHKRLDDASKIVNRKTMNVVSVAFLSSTVLDFFATVSIALVAVFIGFTMLDKLTIGPSISLQQGLFMLLVSPLLFSELKMLGRLYHQKAKAEAGAERFAQIFKEPFVNKANTSYEEVSWLNFNLPLPPLHASQLSIKKGEWVLLSGVSGSGKTSLLEALMGFRSASHTLSGNVAMLSQQVAILDNTVAFNLHLGNCDFSKEWILHALTTVGLLDWYTHLPNGLNTQLGDCPALSGGEAQRLALARILLLQTDIVLLDEPTAHLTDSQHQLIATLIHEKLSNKTVIWASHKSLPQQWFNQHWQIKEGEIEVSRS